jgi:hypothetical protein
MPRPQKPIEEHLKEGSFDPSKHAARLPSHALSAYRSAISRGAGRDVARAEALAALEAGEDVIGRLHEAAYATPAQLMAAAYGGSEWPQPADRCELVAELTAAREAYRRAVAADAVDAYIEIPAPDDPALARQWEDRLWARIAALSDHSDGECSGIDGELAAALERADGRR